MLSVLFIDTTHPVLPDTLSKAGFKVDHFTSFNLDELLQMLPNYEVLVIRSKFTLDKTCIDAAKKLKCIARVGAGMENIDVDYAQSKGIYCVNSPEGNRDAVGEQAVGMLLVLFNKLRIAHEQVQQNRWQREANRGLEIMGKTIGIIGYGNMGSAFAQRLSGFNATVLAYDKYKKNYSDNYAKESTLETLFHECDVISLHVPLTKETYHMVNDNFLSHFKKDIWLLNTARGPVIKTADIVKNLKTKHLLGVALDVLEYENKALELDISKIDDNFRYLQQADNVLLTPHVAGWTVESNIKLAEYLALKIIKLKEETLI